MGGQGQVEEDCLSSVSHWSSKRSPFLLAPPDHGCAKHDVQQAALPRTAQLGAERTEKLRPGLSLQRSLRREVTMARQTKKQQGEGVVQDVREQVRR